MAPTNLKKNGSPRKPRGRRRERPLGAPAFGDLGDPRLAPTPPLVATQLWLDRELRDAIRDVQEQTGNSMAKIVRLALTDYLSAHYPHVLQQADHGGAAQRSAT